MLRGRQSFRLQDGRAAAFDGDKPLFGSDGQAMSPGEWIAGMRDRAPHWFEPSTGSGARPGNQAAGGNPTATTGATVKRSELDANPGMYREKLIKRELTVVPG